jgi:RNA polymerase sigma-70 factor (ECF subfamily)
MENFARESAIREPAPEVPRAGEYDVEAALDSLPEAMRAVVALNVYQGLKYEEVAAALEIPLGTVKSRMFQALRKLREFLQTRK